MCWAPAGRSSVALIVVWAVGVAAANAFAQTTTRGARSAGGDTSWDSRRAQILIDRVIARRATWTGDSDLRDYQAHARGHIYFLFDFGRNTERHLVKADQLALNVFWRAPDQTRQVIVGHRDEKMMPTDIHYHLDHLTLVMDNFGDRINLGEGSEVREALHPAASGALDFYEYRITDSLTLRLSDRQVAVHKVEMRPRDPTGPGLVGAIYIDRDSADIVRMDFTFTAASYLDDQLDYINVRLENALWAGRYWLPIRQGVELRREVRALKLPAGGIIRAEFSIGDYRFNSGVPEGLFRGAPVVYAPARALENFEFDNGLYDALDPSTAMTPPSMEAIRQEAIQILRESYLQSAERLRLAMPGFSSILRFRRAEGFYVGAGLYRSFPAVAIVEALGGRAIGADRWQLIGTLGTTLSASFGLEIAGYGDRPVDVAPWPASSGMIGTLGALTEGEDYRDQYWTTGGTLTLTRRGEALHTYLTVGWESWESATLEADDLVDRSYRPVRAVDEGDAAFLRIGAQGGTPGGLVELGGTSWDARIEGAAGSIAGDFDYVYGAVRSEAYWPSLFENVGLTLSGSAGSAFGGRLPAQRLFPVGGRGSVRGYDFHSFVGNLFASVVTEISCEVYHPFLSVALFADLAWVGIEGEAAERAAAVWNQESSPAGGSEGALLGVGAGIGLLFDTVRIDLARGLNAGGIWELVFSVRSDFWPWL